ncbi:MAG: KH domain-containing protein [Actinobacteria bacterium]|nr:KH domain-containing protein [Actinomycetota bacterium]
MLCQQSVFASCSRSPAHGPSFKLRVADGDLGRVIGRRGRTAQSIRAVVRAAASRDNAEVDVDFLDD